MKSYEHLPKKVGRCHLPYEQLQKMRTDTQTTHNSLFFAFIKSALRTYFVITNYKIFSNAKGHFDLLNV
jgi:hypothetical protein